MVFKAGKYPQGEWSKERTQKLVDTYNPEKDIEAPVVIGHHNWSDTNEMQYAHGWVKGLRMDGSGKVYADIPEFSADAKKAIAENKLRYVSAEIIERDRINPDDPPYLRAIALLGRDSPAIKGTKLPTLFSMMTGGNLQVDETEGVATFTRKAGVEEFAVFGKQTKGEEEGNMGRIEELEAEVKKKDAQLAVFQKEQEELKSKGKKQEAEGYFGKLRDEGKLPPALFERAVALDIRLGEEERKELRTLVGEFETKVDLSGAHIADKKKKGVFPGSDTLTAKIKVYQKEKGFTSFEDAANALYTVQPSLFEEGGTVV
ncbi:MAG: hypothetical protein LBB43_02015 [Spirochaetaceae bacterium]|jgi:hypothetical protein|nr:hypothetical protein [Spirochaetaceae bacterium]